MEATLPRRYRRFIYVAAHIAVLFYVLQVIAIDHWRPSPADVVGFERSQAHVMHCHGAVSGCAGSAAMESVIDTNAMHLFPATATLSPMEAPGVAITDISLPPPDRPPRAA